MADRRRAKPRQELRKTILSDLLSSFVVFLVALPLCMGIAIASGLPPAAGIITGIIGGLIVAPMSGSVLQISGPAAGLAVVVTDLIKQHDVDKLGIIVIIAGVVQVAAGFSKLAQWFRAVPPSVLNGMLSGIGVLIIASQFHVMVDDTPKGSGILNLLSIPAAVWKSMTPDAEKTHHLAAVVGLITITVLILWEKFARGKVKVLPGSLIAIVVATAFTYFLGWNVKYVNLPSNIFESIHFPTFASYHYLVGKDGMEVILDAIAVAFIAAAETLLTASALDKMHRGERTNYDRELMAQGVGNFVSGFLGGLPMTGVMVRSGVNLNAGAKTRMSGWLHGLWLLTFVVCFPHVVKLIPTSGLAALLVYAGYKLANFKVAKELKKYGRSEVAIYVATIILIVCVDLLTGILAGVAFSIAKLLYVFSHLEIRVADDENGNRTDIWVKGAATFLSLPKFAGAIEGVRPETELHLHLEGLEYIDHACLDLMMTWDEQHQASGGKLVMDWGVLGSVFQDRPKDRRTSSITREFRRSKEVSTPTIPLEQGGSPPTK